MKTRSMVFVAAVAAAALVGGCPDRDGGEGGAKRKAAPTTRASVQPVTPGSAPPAVATSASRAFGKGTIRATVRITGEIPEMKVPKKRSQAEFCMDQDVPLNAVIARDGKLKDVYVGIANGQIDAAYEVEKPVTLDQKDCMYQPRILGVVPEQEIIITNRDPVLHQVAASRGEETLFNTAQPRGAPALERSFDETGTYKIGCDVHAWMRSFVIVSDNPFHGITGEDGVATIRRVPKGSYEVVAWHARYGPKKREVTVGDDPVEISFTYDGTEAEPPENPGELNDVF